MWSSVETLTESWEIPASETAVQQNVSTDTITAVNSVHFFFCSHIHMIQTINLKHVGDPLAFPAQSHLSVSMTVIKKKPGEHRGNPFKF